MSNRPRFASFVRSFHDEEGVEWILFQKPKGRGKSRPKLVLAEQPSNIDKKARRYVFSFTPGLGAFGNSASSRKLRSDHLFLADKVEEFCRKSWPSDTGAGWVYAGFPPDDGTHIGDIEDALGLWEVFQLPTTLVGYVNIKLVSVGVREDKANYFVVYRPDARRCILGKDIVRFSDKNPSLYNAALTFCKDYWR